MVVKMEVHATGSVKPVAASIVFGKPSRASYYGQRAFFPLRLLA